MDLSVCSGRAVFALGAGLIMSAACDSGPTAPRVDLGQEFVLAPGERRQVDRPWLSIRFVEVTGDSRCPADVLCIQGGDAVVHIDVTARGAQTTAYELHTADMRPVIHEDVMIALVQLTPYPFSSRTIEQDEYRVTLRATGHAQTVVVHSALPEGRGRVGWKGPPHSPIPIMRLKASQLPRRPRSDRSLREWSRSAR